MFCQVGKVLLMMIAIWKTQDNYNHNFENPVSDLFPKSCSSSRSLIKVSSITVVHANMNLSLLAVVSLFAFFLVALCSSVCWVMVNRNAHNMVVQ